ncbi:putative fatty-acyl- synthase [Rosellinia necatrix]|uniref:Putative fatty-acyl-synthase n=1 Tax=Rosellinia necatrix TaxID=77044 RepID=A0A1S7UMA1_ROSNE|nr:putative fatty-acyl- synthase [Rosellinia necatrix]
MPAHVVSKVATIAGAAAAALTAGMYLDARFLIRNDLRQGNKYLRQLMATRYLAQKARENKLLIYNIFEDRAGTPEGDNVCLIFEGRQWTYTEFYHAIQPVANWLLKDLGIKKGEVVAVNGGNTPEYLMIMLALEAIGAASALLNCNLTGNAIVHSTKVSTSRYLIADRQVQNLVSPVESELKNEGVDTVYYSPDSVRALEDTEPLPKERVAGLSLADITYLLYTSGTTGLPKGVVVPRLRALLLGKLVSGYLGLGPGDRMYTCLPLYHASALVLCALPVFFSGAAVALGRRFGHATFWREVHASGATHLQYVGELCRYLVNAAPGPLDRGHGVRVAWGNGMRPDVWDRFRDRFGVECINELYGASDGMFATMNANRGDFTRHALAVRGPLWHLLNRDERRVLIEPDTQEVLRDKDGWAIEAKADEVGEMISRMDAADPDQGTPQYFGNKSATEGRRVADVFRKGDLWFRSGDLFRLDGQGRLYFVDRLGDTFRWRSENVSTSEVADVVGAFPQVAEANVYGVLVPHADGRAGCAALVPRSTATATAGAGAGEGTTAAATAADPEIDFAALAEHCLARLPRYAVPLFLRVTDSLDYTGTHKMQKQKLRAQGIDLAAIRASSSAGDRVYWLPPGARAYVPFEQADLDDVKAGKVRL